MALRLSHRLRQEIVRPWLPHPAWILLRGSQSGSSFEGLRPGCGPDGIDWPFRASILSGAASPAAGQSRVAPVESTFSCTLPTSKGQRWRDCASSCPVRWASAGLLRIGLRRSTRLRVLLTDFADLRHQTCPFSRTQVSRAAPTIAHLRGSAIPADADAIVQACLATGLLRTTATLHARLPKHAGIQGFQPRTGAPAGAVFRPLAARCTSLGCSRPPGIDRFDLAADFAAAPLSLLPYRAGRCWSLRVSIGRACDALADSAGL